MSIFQPNAVVGNSRLLVTLGGAGEIMGLFWPNVDFPQHVREGMPAVYLGAPGVGQFSWTFEDAWERQQAYLPATNIVETTLRHRQTGLTLYITDFVPPSLDILVRRFRLTNPGAGVREGALLQYFHCAMGEQARKNEAHWVPAQGALLQRWRECCLAGGGDRFEGFQIGKVGGVNSARTDIQDGALSNNPLEIGDVDMALAWRFRLAPGDQDARLLILALADEEAPALELLARARDRGEMSLRQEVTRWSADWLTRAHRAVVPSPFAEVYERSVLALPLITDAGSGAVLAAPEFDPDFTQCGGYGFVWPRDAAEVALAWQEAGFHEEAWRLLEWLARVQRPEGHWDQRYWCSGDPAPGWCPYPDGVQIDQIGAVLHSLNVCIGRRTRSRQELWSVVQRGADYLMKTLGDDGLHRRATDCWERFHGSFAYSNASVRAGLLAAADWADHLSVGQTLLSVRNEDLDHAITYRAAAARIKAAVLTQWWNGSYFARGRDEAGHADWAVDSAMLGLIDPYELLSLDVPEERAIADSMVDVIRQKLTKQLPAGPGIMRHEGDDYVGGAAGAVNTLWMARVLLRLGHAHHRDDPARAAECRNLAETYLRVAIAGASTTGLLPELLDGGTAPRWAVCHGWAMASYIRCALLLASLRKIDR